MVDIKFGPNVTEMIISQSDLPSGGAYTSVGTYDHAEIVALVVNLSKHTQLEVGQLVFTFGEHLLGRFAALYPGFFTEAQDLLHFLSSVDSYIHKEVRKLYPDAKLPNIATKAHADGSFELVYQSDRMMGDLAEGLIKGAIAHFGNGYSCARTDHPDEGGRQCVTFLLRPVLN